jgi:ribosome modulation factor
MKTVPQGYKYSVQVDDYGWRTAFQTSSLTTAKQYAKKVKTMPVRIVNNDKGGEEVRNPRHRPRLGGFKRIEKYNQEKLTELGYQAGVAGKSIDTPDFVTSERERAAWEQGWRAGRNDKKGSNPLPLISASAFHALETDPTLTSMAEYGAAGEAVSKAKGLFKRGRKKRNALRSTEFRPVEKRVFDSYPAATKFLDTINRLDYNVEINKLKSGKIQVSYQIKAYRNNPMISPSMVGKYLGGRIGGRKNPSITINDAYSLLKSVGWIVVPTEEGIEVSNGKRLQRFIPYTDKLGSLVDRDSVKKLQVLGQNKIKNPSNSDLQEAEDVSREWHGRDPQEVVEIDEEEVYEDVGAILADLEELGVLADEDGKLETWAIRFKRDRPKLTCDLAKENLEIVGGDQELELDDDGKDDKALGYCYQIVYETDKHHLEGSNGYPESYEHFFGEEFYKGEGFDQDDYKTSDDFFEDVLREGVVMKAISKGYLPMVVYNVPNCKIRLIGGKYKIKDVGIED